MPKGNKLTLKQAKFVKEYVKTGNGTESVKRAYQISDDNVAGAMAHENLRKPKIASHIQSAAEKLGLNAEYVLSGIKEVFEFNKQKRIKAKQVGQETYHEEEMIDAQACLKAGDLLGKHLKLFTPEEKETQAQVNIVVNQIDDKLKAIIDVTPKKKGIEELI